MASIINDIIGPPRRRSRNPEKSPRGESPSIKRKSTTDLLKGTSKVPTQPSTSKKDSSIVVAPAEFPLPPAELAETLALQEAASSDIPAPADLPPDEGSAQEAASSAQAAVEVPTHEDLLQEVEKSAPKAEEAPPPSELPIHDTSQKAEKSAPEADDAPVKPLTILEPTPVVDSSPTILIGIAGATASGKSALAHLLSLVLPRSTKRFIIYQNDFFIPEHFLLPNRNGAHDSDCRDAVDFPAMLRVLTYAKRMGVLPPDYDVADDSTEYEFVGSSVAPEIVKELKEMLDESGALDGRRAVGIVEGFLLYHEPEIRDMLDIKFFLRVREEQARASRLAKPGYSPASNFWALEQYFDETAWPNFVHEHRPLFENGNVEGMPLFGLCDKLNIIMQPRLDMNVEQILAWATRSIPRALEQQKAETTRDLEEDRSINAEASFFRKYEACDCSEGWLGRVRKVLYDIV